MVGMALPRVAVGVRRNIPQHVHGQRGGGGLPRRGPTGGPFGAGPSPRTLQGSCPWNRHAFPISACYKRKVNVQGKDRHHIREGMGCGAGMDASGSNRAGLDRSGTTTPAGHRLPAFWSKMNSCKAPE